MKPSEILREAAKLPWCYGSFAVDSAGHSCSRLSEYAVGFCAIGALGRVLDGAFGHLTGDDWDGVKPIYSEARDALMLALPAGHVEITTFSDSTPPGPERDAWFARAVALLEAEGK